jgi:hypothetical protein
MARNVPQAFACAFSVLALIACGDDSEPVCSVDHLDLAIEIIPVSTMLERGCLAPLPCSDGAYVDLEPTMSGTQYRCDVSDVQHYGQADQAEQVIAPCGSGQTSAPCWRVVDDASCPAQSMLELVRVSDPAIDNVVAAYCWADCQYCGVR